MDLFCGAGGAAMGWAMAGFEVVGVDLEPQPNYPFDFVQADALELLRFAGQGGTIDELAPDLIHASPPCQRYANVTRWRGDPDDHLDLLEPTLEALVVAGRPWVVENVPEAIRTPDLVLCGTMFDLAVKRHRHFLSSVPLWSNQAACRHSDLFAFMHKGERSYAEAMGCGWMTNLEAREAIPPAYTRWIGSQLIGTLALDAIPSGSRWARCQRCRRAFPCQRSTARYCTAKCRDRAHYDRTQFPTLRGSYRRKTGVA